MKLLVRAISLLAVIMVGLLSFGSVFAEKTADPDKVLRYVFGTAEDGFDPAIARDLYSAHITQSIFETLYTYDYLARPAKLIPLTAEAMPEISADGKIYTIHLKKGIYFQSDSAFHAHPRELTIADYIYSYKRLFDPRLNSPHTWLWDGKVEGLDEFAAEARKNGHFDIDKKVPGFEQVDRYTLRIHLKQPDYNLGMILAHQPNNALAREVVEKYQDAQGQVMANPVGTGPYKLGKWVRGSRIVLDANPEYRGMTWNFQPGSDPEDQKIVAQMKGKRMPQIGHIDISVIEEGQSRLLAFRNDEIDLFQLGGQLAPQVLNNGKLKPEYADKGVQLSRIVDPEITYDYWNMQDRVLGGLSKEKIALRRAIALAYNTKEEIQVLYNGEAQALEYPIPPGVVGYDPHYRSTLQYDPTVANALLDKFNYKIGTDGWRTGLDGKPLVIKYSTHNNSAGAQQAEMWKKTFDLIHIRMIDDRKPFSDILKAEKACLVQTRTAAWIADYPDGDNFMQLFFGPNAGQNNNGCAKVPEYDTLYKQSQKLPDGPERDLLYHKMARVLEFYAPVRIGSAGYRNMLSQPRVIGYKKHPILSCEWMYFDIDKHK